MIVVLGCWLLTGCAAVPTQQVQPAGDEPVRPANAGNEAIRLVTLAQKHVESFEQTQDVRDLDKAMDALRELRRLQPDDPRVNLMTYFVLVKKALAEFDEGLLDELKERYDAAYRMAPALARELPPPAFVAGTLYGIIGLRRGLSVEQKSSYEDKALEAFRETVRQRPAFATGHLMLSVAYAGRGLDELALFEAREAVKLAPESPNAQRLLGQIYGSSIHQGPDCWDEHAIDEGIKAYKKVVSLAPEDPAGHSGLSSLYLHKEAYELSVFEAREAARLLKSPYTLMRVGVSLIHLGDYEEAIGALQQALTMHPRYATALEWTGFAHFVRQDFEKAVHYYRRAAQARKRPSFYPSLNLNLALLSLGREKEAAAVLDKLGEPLSSDAWEQWLLRFGRGQIGEAELLAAADNRCKRTEALCFSGYRHLMAGEREPARDRFREAVAFKVYCISEYVSARAGIRYLEGK
jgi:tetratricopeptide (TPR) repeat protein